jgi:hypothetical protein
VVRAVRSDPTAATACDTVSASYALLFAAALIALWVTCRLEPSTFGAACIRLLDRAGTGLRHRSEDLLRTTTAAFFIAIWVNGHIILTPELGTESTWVPWLQAGIAAGMFSRATLIPAALGIVVLFAYGRLGSARRRRNNGKFSRADRTVGGRRTVDPLDRARARHDAAHGERLARPVCT